MSPPPPSPRVPIRLEDEPLFTSVNTFVHTYMSAYDNSHDYHHILRVVSNANMILQSELKSNPSADYDTTALFLAALLHDVGDRKYATPDEDIENQIFNLLQERGASDELATKVQTIAKTVSYSHEVKNPDVVAATLQKYPELAIVQDADRLDAIGAVGVARCFSYGAAKFPEKPMSRAIVHFEEKLYKVGGMMKTQSGREMARKRTRVLEDFAKEWESETALSFELV